MRVTLHYRGTTKTHDLEHGLELGGDPRQRGVAENLVGPWTCAFRRQPLGWAFDLRAGSQPDTTLNGTLVVGNWLYPVDYGDVIVAGELTITVGYLASALPVAAPLSATERTLLGAIARDDDDQPRRVLADLWQEGDDDVRGTLIHAQCEGLELGFELVARHGDRWRQPAIAAGFTADQLVFERGFVPPFVLAEREPFARSADAFRLSPVIYHPIRSVLVGLRTEVHEAVRMTATGADTTVAIKSPTTWDPDASFVIERELQILRRFESPHLPAIRDVALVRRGGKALVMEWRGPSLDAILGAARAADRAPGEAVAISIGIQLCGALAVSHAANVTHCELAPDHVVIQDGRVTLCDFGYARCDLKLPRAQISPTGMIRSRFGYMSPEQVRGETLDHATDVFALAMLVAELVTLQHPIAGRTSDFDTLVAIRDLAFTLPATRSTLAAKLGRLLVRDRAPRASAALLGLELARIAETAHVRVGPDVIADYTRSLGL